MVHLLDPNFGDPEHGGSSVVIVIFKEFVNQLGALALEATYLLSHCVHQLVVIISCS